MGFIDVSGHLVSVNRNGDEIVIRVNKADSADEYRLTLAEAQRRLQASRDDDLLARAARDKVAWQVADNLLALPPDVANYIAEVNKAVETPEG